MVHMCKAVYVSSFESNFKNDKSVLANNSAYLEYLCEFHDHPGRFKKYKTEKVKGTMMWSGSQFSKANDANIMSRLGCSSLQMTHLHVVKLLHLVRNMCM